MESDLHHHLMASSFREHPSNSILNEELGQRTRSGILTSCDRQVEVAIDRSYIKEG